MRIAWDQGFTEERARYGLAHCCEDCGQFDPARGRCAHEFPTDGHRAADYAPEGGRLDILFCKEFELC